MADASYLKRPNPSQDSPAAKRQHQGRQRSAPRASQACHACATSKTKCDNQPTCGRCRKRNVSCIRYCQVPHQDAQPESQATLENTALKDQILPMVAENLPTPNVDDMIDASQVDTFQDSVNMLASTRYDTGKVQGTPGGCLALIRSLSSVPLDNGINSRASQPSTQDITDQLSAPTLAPLTWSFDTSFDLFELDSKLDWGLNLHEVDFLSSLQLPQASNTIVPHQDSYTTAASPVPSSDGEENSDTVQQAFCQSIGQWTPDSSHYRGHGERNMVSEDLIHLKMDILGQGDISITREPLVPRTRDKLVAMAVASCEPGNINAIVSAFPSVEVLESLINVSLTQQKNLVDAYIHIPTFSKLEARLETLAAIVIHGTIGSPSRAVQKFGYGLGEILSCYVHSKAERNYSLTRDLQYLQAFCLNLDYGIWSGIKNKMELAGSHSGVLINMLRAGGRFHRTSYSTIVPTSVDVDETLERKWRAWVTQESFKRIVYHIQIHCVQESFMAATAGSHLSSSELSLPLPESRELWLAPSATLWKQAWLRLQPGGENRVPSVIECVGEPGKACLLPRICDHEFATLAQLYTIASLVRNFKQTQSLFTTTDPSLNKLALIADEGQERRLTQIIQELSVNYASHETAAWNLLRELSLMHLHTSFDQMEIFAGRFGPEEARSAYPILYSWCQSQSARRAVWHAGQVLRHMRTVPVGSLHIFHALLCYHAGLCLCAYGFFLNSYATKSAPGEPFSKDMETVALDGEETLAIQRWILSGIGNPTIASSLKPDKSRQSHVIIPLGSMVKTMSVVIGIVHSRFQEQSETLPLLVEKICHLMRSIGKIERAKSSDLMGVRDS